MIITNLSTNSTLSLRGASGAIYDALPSGTVTVPNGEISDIALTNYVSNGRITVTGWSPGGSTAPTVAAPYTITQTVVTLTAATSTSLIVANASRKYLSFMVTGADDVTVVPGAGPAVAGAGLVYQAQATGKQGGSQEFPTGAPTNAFQAISTAGSRVIVWEGI
jgi:hypothetical protein